MKTWILIALLVGALAFAGCTGADAAQAGSNLSDLSSQKTAGMEQFLNNSSQVQPIAPAAPEAPVPTPQEKPPAAPAVSNTSSASVASLTWDQKDALKITMLRKGEKMEFTSWQVRLDNITFDGVPRAGYTILSGDGKAISSITLAQNQSYRFTASDGADYFVVAVFRIGEGMPIAVQTQAYKVSDLNKSASGILIGAPLNSYNLNLDYPPPQMLVNQTLALGDIAAGGEIGAELVSIDRSSSPPLVNLRILDSAKSEAGLASLRNGQMVDVRIPSGVRYSVVMAGVGSGETAVVLIYKKG